MTVAGQTEPSVKIQLACFVNPAGLQALGNNLYGGAAPTGAPNPPRRMPQAAARSARAPSKAPTSTSSRSWWT